MQNNTWSVKGVSFCYFVVHNKIDSGLERDHDIQGAIQNRDHRMEISHIDYTTYFQLHVSETERLQQFHGCL